MRIKLGNWASIPLGTLETVLSHQGVRELRSSSTSFQHQRLGAAPGVVNSPALPAYSEGGWSLGFWPASVQMVNTKMDVSRVPTDNAGEMTRGGDVGLNTFGRNSYELN